MSTENSTLPNTENRATDSIEQFATFYKACSDTLRLDVLRVLARDSYGVLELCNILETKQSAMSHHLKVLASAGLVETRREGNSIFYHRAPQAIKEELQAVQDALFRNLDLVAIRPEIAERISQVQRVRASSSQHFFTENAYKFREQQDLIASYDQYAVSVADLINSADFPPTATALEIGPGEGTFLSELAAKFISVDAIDNSQEMLNSAQAFVAENKLTNVNLIYGDTKTALRKHIKANCAVCNMVLHHVPSPAKIFEDVAELLQAGGSFFVTDLCSHDQTWVKDACGDLWLGFDPADLTHWANAAGLVEGKSVYLALRNGFRIQVRQFDKLTIN